jgi:hypothetical protein
MYYYLYLIKFDDGRYYIGSRKCKCKPEEDTGYMGSPVTFKELWIDPNLNKKKYIIREVDSVKELRRIEPKLIKEAWKKDGKNICLNRHASPTFHPEVCSKGGKISGKKSYEQGTGIHGLTKEERSYNGKMGGKISGKKSYEQGTGIYGLSEEQINKYRKMGAKIMGEKSAKEFVIVSPTGEVIQGKNLRKFCREYQLDRRGIFRVLKGIQSHCKGWTQYVGLVHHLS